VIGDLALTDDALVLSGYAGGGAESVLAVIDPADLGAGTYDLSVARGCVRTPGYLGPSVTAGGYLGEGQLQVALGGRDVSTGYVLDLEGAGDSCE
jgi:hypothetical protein